MTPENEKELIRLLEGIGNVDVVNFGKYTWEDQVRLSAANDIMIGVHGNNLTNFMWCPPNATCIEIFPEGSRAYDYQMQAEFFGHDYYGIDGDKIYTAFSRVGHPYGAIHEGVKGLPREQILLALHRFL
jgi:capsular polysaccharide biosynthesis protein